MGALHYKEFCLNIPKYSYMVRIFFRSGFPGSEPVSLDRDRIQLLGEKPYRVSWKADGPRYMMLIAGKDEVDKIDFFVLMNTYL